MNYNANRQENMSLYKRKREIAFWQSLNTKKVPQKAFKKSRRGERTKVKRRTWRSQLLFKEEGCWGTWQSQPQSPISFHQPNKPKTVPSWHQSRNPSIENLIWVGTNIIPLWLVTLWLFMAINYIEFWIKKNLIWR